MSRPMIRAGSTSCARALSAPRTHRQLHSRTAAVNSDALLAAPPRLRHRRWPAQQDSSRRPRFMSSGQALHLKKKEFIADKNMPPNWREEVEESLAKVDRAAAEEGLKANKSHLEDLEETLSRKTLKPDSPWGLAVYRTCYNDEAAWQEMKEDLEARPRESMEFYVDDGLFDRHQFVFMDDKARFDGATPYESRGHFAKWAREELARHWAVQPVTEEMLQRDIDQLIDTAGTRYNICMVVDEREPAVAEQGHAHGAPDDADDQHPDYADGWMYDRNEGYGGWVYSSTLEYVDTYDKLSDCNNWEEDWMFAYPSVVYDNMGLERSPAFWRDEIAAERAKAAAAKKQ
ncbi:hypothetical protein ACCO45_006749 [Purpureocillium lilacinum]|uniref:Uncharacterized protein n=1 Tax=Purpureocillium lilacinum TaxID=33203 RepID=A0ACC4DR78_PURLI